MGRHILHVDMNAFYASVECQRRPELRQKPVAVCGDPEARHGIVLTANYVAKPRGVKTGMAIWQAKQLCPDLVVLPADMREYIRFSKMAREIYEKYTDQIEPFGLDESWLDVTGSVGLFGSAVSIAEEISERIKFELGITASIAFPTIRSRRSWVVTIRHPLCGLFLMWCIAEKHQVLVGGFPQTIDDLGCVKTYAAVAGGQELRHTALMQHHDLLRQLHFQFLAAVIFLVKPPRKAHGCLSYDRTAVYTAAFFQSSHTFTRLLSQ